MRSRFRVLGAAGLFPLAACFVSTEHVGQAEGASSVNTAGAKVFLCDKPGDETTPEAGGCMPCSQKIGDYTLTDQQREACTLRELRGELKDHIRFLVGYAGRKGAFLRSVDGNAPLRLKEIKVLPAVGPGENPRQDVYTKLAGSFTMGKGDNASSADGGVAIHSVRMSVRFAFIFEDSTSGKIVRSEPFVMDNTYNLIPFFYSKMNAGLNLSIGGILSSFVGAPEIANTLLAALGGNAGVSFEADHEVEWHSPVCADTVNDRSGVDQDQKLRVFDYDFFKSVLKPVCDQYKADNHDNVSCDFRALIGDTNTFLEQSKRAIGNRRVLPITGCKQLEKSRWLGLEPVFDLSFVAPERWGWAPDHGGWLYQSDARAPNVWQKHESMGIFGVETGGQCGQRALAPGEVCVHTQLARFTFGDECNALNSASTSTFGIAQSEGTDGQILQSR